MPRQYARNVDLERATAIRVSLIEHSQASLVAREAELDVSMFPCLPRPRAEIWWAARASKSCKTGQSRCCE